MRFGGRPKLAAFLYFNYDIGDIFTMEDLRRGLGSDAPDSAEQLGRRLRHLREQEWRFNSYRDQPGLRAEHYALMAKGKRIWLGEKVKVDKPSLAVKRQVLERDLNRCVVCGVGAGEPYPGEPNSKARMTIGHRTAGARLSKTDPDNLQAECARCNEPVGDTPPNPEQLDEVMAVVTRLGGSDKQVLLDWLIGGRRIRNKVDMAYDRVRRLSASERATVILRLEQATGGAIAGQPRSG